MHLKEIYIHQLRKIALFLMLPSLLAVFLMCTDPYRLSLPLLLVPFLLFAAMVYRLAEAMLSALRVSKRRGRMIAAMLTTLLLVLALLQSIHQLSLKDLLILAALLLGMTLYLRRLDL